ncbi:MAG: hypothetical protein GX062_04445 [Firmicutes bacterium]|jgi:energy-coupling factor transport system permease protein|nr:hypothetical protein [Bacillota bacterium]
MRRRFAALAFPALHPSVSLTYAGALLVLLLLYTHPLYLLALAALPGVTLASRQQGRLWRRRLAWSLLLCFFIVLFNAIFGGRGATPLLVLTLPGLGVRHVTLEGLLYGGTMALRLGGVIGSFTLLADLVDLERLLYSSPLAGRASLTAALTLGLVPRLSRSARTLLEVQASRGAPVTATNLRRGVRAAGPLLAALSETALESSLDMAEVLAARGYGSGRATRWRRQGWHLRDTLVMAGSALALVYGFSAYRAGVGQLTYYPTLSLPGAKPGITELVVITGLLLLPAALFWGWRYCRWLRASI